VERVEVRVIDLVKKLKENREQHRELYETARDGYREQAVKMFRAELAKAEAGWDFRNNVFLDPPQDHTTDYDNAIEMLEMTLEAGVRAEFLRRGGTIVPGPLGFGETEAKTSIYHFDDWDAEQVGDLLYSISQGILIEITRKDFACFVRDDWGWKDAWTSNVTGYTIGPGSGK